MQPVSSSSSLSSFSVQGETGSNARSASNGNISVGKGRGRGGKLRFDLAKVRNSEDELIISSLESSHRMLNSSRARILDNTRYRKLSDKEQGWLHELDQQEQALIGQARAANLLLEEVAD